MQADAVYVDKVAGVRGSVHPMPPESDEENIAAGDSLSKMAAK
jgi:hypothetical protein